MMLYVIIFCIGSIIMTLLGVDFMSSIGAVAATLGNVGPGIGSVSPGSTYSNIPDLGKWILSLLIRRCCSRRSKIYCNRLSRSNTQSSSHLRIISSTFSNTS